MSYPLTRAAIAASILLIMPAAFAANGTLNDTTAHAQSADAANPGHAHRGMSTPHASADTATTPGATNPTVGTSASGMGTTDNTMSSSTGSEGSARH